MTRRPLHFRTAPRLLAVAQSFIWLMLLSHGGWALLFVPMALLAATIGGRHPVAGPVLLAPPVVWLTLSWVPALSHATASGWTIWILLVAPAALASIGFTLTVLQQIRDFAAEPQTAPRSP